MVRLTSTAALVSAWLACATCLAQPTDATERARERFQRGVELFDDGHPELALPEFEAAYQLAPTFEVLFNIGISASRAGRHARAIQALQDCLDEAGDAIEEPRREEVEAELSRLRSLVGRLTLELLPDGTSARLDGVPLGSSPFLEPVTVSAGRHELELSAAGYETQRRRLTILSGQTLVMVIELAVLERASASGGGGPSEVPATAEPWPERAVGWSLVGLGVAAGALGVVFGGLAIDADARLSRQLATFPGDPARLAGTRDELAAYGATADTLGGVGLGLIAAGAIVLLVTELTRGADE